MVCTRLPYLTRFILGLLPAPALALALPGCDPGACCQPDGACTETTQATCTGTWTIGGSCTPNPCLSPPTGSCYTADGVCTITTQANCADNWTAGGTCDPNPYPQPTGSCCAADGACTITTQADCTGTWTSGGTCSPNPCPQPTGSCCAANGACTVTTQADCAGTWTSGGTCTPNPCPQCYVNADCNDNNPCTTDACVNGVCVYTPIMCNDNNPCTTDACVNGVCVYTPIMCNDNNPCTTDACVNGVCVYTPIVCNDNDSCTTDACVNGVCVYTSIMCNDNNPCTTDACVNGVCVYTPIVCNDDNPCTTDACVNGVCVYTPIVCNDTVPVGNPGNAGEWSGESYGGYGPDRICGAVDYVYNIGKYEVTAGQYTEFLNKVADTDTYGLYNTSMDAAAHSSGCNIKRSGSSGAYTYTVGNGSPSDVANWASRPVNYVSWGDAARFANWLYNGQPTGAQGLSTTEDGSYYLNGATTNEQLLAVTRKANATWVIPSEDEWYKAAYHKNDGVTGNYWDYPTSSNSVPSNVLGDPTDPGNNATYYDYYGTGTGGYTIGSPYYRTEVGAHENSDSPYGTFDQGGNVWEWNEAILYGSYRCLRGGSFDNVASDGLHASLRNNIDPTDESYGFGFRVSEVH